MIEIISVKDIKDATPEELANLRRKGLLPAEGTRRTSGRPLSPYERTRAQVAATGNRYPVNATVAPGQRYDICCTLRLLPYATYKLMAFPFSP